MNKKINIIIKHKIFIVYIYIVLNNIYFDIKIHKTL